MGEVGLGRRVVDPQLLRRPVQQRDHVGRIGHPVAILHPLAVLRHPADGPQRRLADQRRRTGRPLLFAAAQGGGGQGERRKPFAARAVLGLGLRRRAAIDRTRAFAVVRPNQRRQTDAHAAHGPAGNGHQAHPFEEPPPRHLLIAVKIDWPHCRHPFSVAAPRGPCPLLIVSQGKPASQEFLAFVIQNRRRTGRGKPRHFARSRKFTGGIQPQSPAIVALPGGGRQVVPHLFGGTAILAAARRASRPMRRQRSRSRFVEMGRKLFPQLTFCKTTSRIAAFSVQVGGCPGIAH